MTRNDKLLKPELLSQVKNQVRDIGWDQVCDQVRDRVWFSVLQIVRSKVVSQVWEHVLRQVYEKHND